MEKKNSDARIAANNRYNAKTYKQFNVKLKHDEMEQLENHCKKFGYTKNGFAIQAIKEKMERDHTSLN